MENGRWNSYKMRRRPFLSFFSFFFFFFLLLTFQNHYNLFWVYQNGNFLPGKSISGRKKKSRKMTLPPQKNFSVTPLITHFIFHTHYIKPNTVKCELIIYVGAAYRKTQFTFPTPYIHVVPHTQSNTVKSIIYVGAGYGKLTLLSIGHILHHTQSNINL